MTRGEPTLMVLRESWMVVRTKRIRAVPNRPMAPRLPMATVTGTGTDEPKDRKFIDIMNVIQELNSERLLRALK